MKSGDFLPDEIGTSGEEPEISAELRRAIKNEMASAIAEQKAAETVSDLVQTQWLLDMVIDKVLTSLEQQGLVLDGMEQGVSDVIAQSILELLPEGGENRGQSSESSGVREPRRPIRPSLLGSIALDLPNGSV